MPRDIQDSMMRVAFAKPIDREEFIKQQEEKAKARKTRRAPVPLKQTGTLFAKRNKLLALREAALRRVQVVITYTKITTGETKKYIVAPYEFSYRRLRRGRRRVFWGWDMRDGHIKSFVIQTIHNVAITDRKFSPRYPVLIHTWMFIPTILGVLLLVGG